MDIDSTALSTCKANLSQFGIANVDLLQQDVMGLACAGSHLQKAFDTVIMNPPFGTKNTKGKLITIIKSFVGLFLYLL